MHWRLATAAAAPLLRPRWGRLRDGGGHSIGSSIGSSIGGSSGGALGAAPPYAAAQRRGLLGKPSLAACTVNYQDHNTRAGAQRLGLSGQPE